jgi:Xaa-Pro aminopeptidase
MREAAAASAAGYAKLVSMMRPGISERALQIEMEAEFFRGGADRTGYESIVASGPRSAILHAPATERKLGDGELLLVDAGAQVRRYVIDITRTYAVNGKLSGLQKDLYDVVLKAEENAIRASKVGTWWHEVHLGASRDMVAGLVALGIMRGDPASLVEQEAHTLFFPHGLGHMVGLGVRDASGRLPGDRREIPPMLSTLRTDMPLEPGYALTVEPGIYFVPPLLKNPDKRARYKDAVNWSKVDTLMDFGGIRIEDNLIIRKDGPEVLTQAVPK